MRIKELALETSIHSTQTGRDMVVKYGQSVNQHFNPLYPNGQRQQQKIAKMTPKQLQSTLPKRVETNTIVKIPVSIYDFNPLYPNGQRHYFFIRFHRNEQLQSTLPKRVETSLHGSRLSAICNFNPLYPNGQRRVSIKRGACRLNFNPLYPNGQRPISSIQLNFSPGTSIHSTQTGRDLLSQSLHL